MLAFIITFIAVFITDVVNAYYIKAITDEKPLTASLWATFVTLTASIAVINFTNDNINLIAALLGAFTGTYVAIKYKK
jgi:hypothetical protein